MRMLDEMTVKSRGCAAGLQMKARVGPDAGLRSARRPAGASARRAPADWRRARASSPWGLSRAWSVPKVTHCVSATAIGPNHHSHPQSLLPMVSTTLQLQSSTAQHSAAQRSTAQQQR